MEHQPALALDEIEKTQISPHIMLLCAPEDMLHTITTLAISRGFRCVDVTNIRRYSGGTALTQARGWVQARIPYDIGQRGSLDALIEEIMRQPTVLGKPILEAWIGGVVNRYTIKR